MNSREDFAQTLVEAPGGKVHALLYGGTLCVRWWPNETWGMPYSGRAGDVTCGRCRSSLRLSPIEKVKL